MKRLDLRKHDNYRNSSEEASWQPLERKQRHDLLAGRQEGTTVNLDLFTGLLLDDIHFTNSSVEHFME